MKNNELLREEWRKEYQPDRYIADINKNVESTADWWLSKIDSLKAELVEELKKLEDTSGIFSDPWRNGMKEGRNSTLDEAIELVKKI